MTKVHMKPKKCPKYPQKLKFGRNTLEKNFQNNP